MIDVIIVLILLLIVIITLSNLFYTNFNNKINQSKMSHFSKDQEKAIEQIVKQSLQQALGGVGIDKNITFDSQRHDTGQDEAFQTSVYSNARLWNWNDKAHAVVEHSREQNDRVHSAAMNNIDTLAARDAAAFQSALRWEYAKFNAAASEPINPNVFEQEKGKK